MTCLFPFPQIWVSIVFGSHGIALLMLDAAHSVVCESVFLPVTFQPY